MRVLAAAVLLSLVIAGCGDQAGVRQAAYADRLGLATDAAQRWNAAAVLVGAFGVERAADVPVPAWMQEAPAEVRDAKDPRVGDGLAPWWTYAFQAGNELAFFAVSASGVADGPVLDSVLTEEGDDESTAPVEDVLDPAEVRSRLQASGEWSDPQGLVTWDLLHYTLADPTVWIVRQHAGGSGVLVADAATAKVLCRGPGDVTFVRSDAVHTGQVTALMPWQRSFDIADGHRGIEVQLSGSDEALNELELTLTSPTGDTTTLSWGGGAAPTTLYIPSPAGGSWDATVRQTGGVVASLVLRIETDGSAITC